MWVKNEVAHKQLDESVLMQCSFGLTIYQQLSCKVANVLKYCTKGFGS